MRCGIHAPWGLLMLLILLTSCGASDAEKQSAYVREKTQEYMNLLSEGRLDEFVEAHAHSNTWPDSYRQQMVGLQKQFVEKVQEAHGGWNQLEVVDDSISGQKAFVYVRVSYKDGGTETILVPLTYVDGDWRL